MRAPVTITCTVETMPSKQPPVAAAIRSLRVAGGAEPAAACAAHERASDLRIEDRE